MKNNCKIFLLCIGLISLLNSCCRDKRKDITGKQCEPRPDEYYYYWLGEAKDYMYFKPGTWWVYKNVNTGLIDTIVVYNTSLDTIIAKGMEEKSYYRIYMYETATVRVSSLKYNIFYSWYSRGPNPDATGIAPQSTSWNRTRYGAISVCFITPLELHYRDDVDLITKDTSIQIGSKTYQNVQVFKIDPAPAYYDILDPFTGNNKSYSLMYYAKNYGLIKSYKKFENLTIELIESNIIQ